MSRLSSGLRERVKMKNIAIIGTQGVPAKYGGFETLVENIIGDNCSDDICYTIFCSSKDMPTKIKESNFDSFILCFQ